MRTTIIAFSLVTYLLSGCSEFSQPTESQLGMDINGKSAIYAPSQKFTLELDVHYDGGYQWSYDISNSSVVQLDSTSYRSKSGNQGVGGLAVETFYFRTITSGQSTVSLYERRIWEKDNSPINTVQFGVLVKKF